MRTELKASKVRSVFFKRSARSILQRTSGSKFRHNHFKTESLIIGVIIFHFYRDTLKNLKEIQVIQRYNSNAQTQYNILLRKIEIPLFLRLPQNQI